MNEKLHQILNQKTVSELLKLLNVKGEKAWIVGGAVRNAILDFPIYDIDIATTALPNEVMLRVQAHGLNCIPTGINYGTVTVIEEGKSFEITTLREDVETDGRRAVVRFGRNLQADAMRRDFTINALYLTQDGDIIDIVGGMRDLEERKVRFIGDATGRIREDYLRILRFFRFYAEYGGNNIDEIGLKAILKERQWLSSLSKDRVRTELLKILISQRSINAIRVMCETGLLVELLGGTVNFQRFEIIRQLEIEKNMAPSAGWALASLSVEIQEDVYRVHERLLLSNKITKELNCFASLAELVRKKKFEIRISDILSFHYKYGYHSVISLRGILISAGFFNDKYSSNFSFCDRKKEIIFPFSGNDILKYNVPEGKLIGEILKKLEFLWLKHNCPTDPHKLQLLLESVILQFR